MWKCFAAALCLLLPACHRAQKRQHASGSSPAPSAAAAHSAAPSAAASTAAPAPKHPDFGTEIKPAQPPRLDLVNVTQKNLQRLVTGLGWEVLTYGGMKRQPGKRWNSQVNADKGKLFALVAVHCEPKPVAKLGNYFASGSAYYRTKQCTLTVSVTQGQGGPDRRSDAVALANALLGSTL